MAETFSESLEKIVHSSVRISILFSLTHLILTTTVLSLTIFYDSHPRRYDRDDPLVRKVAENILYRWEMMARGHGMWHPYKYINYLDGHTDAFAGYGEKQREFMRGVKKGLLNGGVRWDVGGFKV